MYKYLGLLHGIWEPIYPGVNIIILYKTFVCKGKKTPLPHLSSLFNYQFSNRESLFQMYISLVHPNLEYASQIWSLYACSYKVGEINCIELRSPKICSAYVCAKNWDASYQDLLQLFSLPNLQSWEKSLVIRFMLYVQNCSLFILFPWGCFLPPPPPPILPKESLIHWTHILLFVLLLVHVTITILM